MADGAKLSSSDVEECDERTFTFIESSDAKQTPSSPPQVKGLDLRGAMELFMEEPIVDSVQEEEIIVVFILPDGSEDEAKFKLGHTVEYLKSFIELQYGITMSDCTLYVDERMMLDPMSLNDYPDAISNSEMFVRIEGHLPAESKK
jgi:hypothetical protein